jgi:hypothetical protein
VSVDVLLLALVATVDPLMMGVVLLLLSRPRPILQLGCYLGGGFVASFAVCLALVEGLRGVGLPGLDDLPAGVRIAAGAVLIVAALVVYRRAAGRRRDADPSAPPTPSTAPAWLAGLIERSGPGFALLVGAVANLPGGYTLVAMTAVAQGHPSTTSAVLQILVFNLIMFLPAEIPLVVHAVRPAAAERVVVRLRGLMSRYGGTVALVVLTIIGVALVVTGVRDAG